jgi:two-component system, NtrC family, response regulator HydG
VGGRKVLLVDDEPNALRVLSAILSAEGFSVHEAQNVKSACRKIVEEDLDAVITDMKMPEQDGLALYEYITGNFPDIPVIFLTAYGTVESAVDAMHHGAYHYFIKPPDYCQLKEILNRAVDLRCQRRVLAQWKKELVAGYRIIGGSPGMQRIGEMINSFKDSGSSVLLTGETGTGKELIARALHLEGRRRQKPFVAVNCAAIPRELIEAELFGHEKGAFTGAVSRRIGRVEQAAGGTLFLDEIGELDPAVQAKFLRVLQEKEVERLGGDKKIAVDFRLLSSTNRDLTQEVRSGGFREDLFYRINVVTIPVPPLRERREDIPMLVESFLQEFCSREGKVLSVSAPVMRILQQYDWPGNIRQLRNILERATVMARGRMITEKDLPEELFKQFNALPANETFGSLKEMEGRAIRAALERFQGNKSKAAKMLGMSRKTFYKRLNELNITT